MTKFNPFKSRYDGKNDFVVTSGKNDWLRGKTISIEYAERIGERLRNGTEYTIWMRHNGRWMVRASRRAGPQ